MKAPLILSLALLGFSSLSTIEAQVVDTSSIPSIPSTPPPSSSSPTPPPQSPQTSPQANSSTPSPAQGDFKQRFEQRLAFLSQKLNLTAAEKTQIGAILEKEWPQIKAIREDSSLSDDQKKEQIRAIALASREKMKAVLTPAQQEELPEALQELRQQQQANQ